MLGIRLPFFAHIGQIPLVIITFFSCGLSFWLTVRFCATLAPGHAAAELLTIGMTWELAKLTFSIQGTHRIRRGLLAQKASGYRLVSLSLVLAAGSIAASLAFLMQTDRHILQGAAKASQQALHASKAYERDTASLRTLDGEIEQLTALAEQYRAKGLVTQGVRTLERIKPLRDERITQARALSAQEAAITSGSPIASASPFLGDSSVWRLVAQVVLAVMLEVVSMVALSLLCEGKSGPAQSGSASPKIPAANVVRLKVASPRITSDANPHRFASGTISGDGDANGQQPLWHRIGADSASSRITCDASLHRSASGYAVCDTNVSSPTAGQHRINTNAAPMRITCDAPAHRPASPRMGAGASLALVPVPDATRGGRDTQRLCALYAHAKQLICSAQVRPSYREMRQALGASQPVVQRFLRDLVTEGVLCRDGARYALVSPLSANGGAI